MRLFIYHRWRHGHCVRCGLHGVRGRMLTKAIGAPVAGALIYHASTGRVPDFYATTDDALADIRAYAARAAGEGG